MYTESKNSTENEKGIALITTLMLMVLLSILVAAMLSSSTSDVLIAGNDVRTNQAFYVAEAGINRAAGWFSARFGPSASYGRFVLPLRYPSNTVAVPGKLSYTAPLDKDASGNPSDTPDYKTGASITSPEQSLPTAVKVLYGGFLQNVILAGDGSNTYPPSYTLIANNAAGIATTYTYDNVVSDFASNLVDQQEGEGQFTIKAVLISIIPPGLSTGTGTITWKLESTGRILRGTSTIGSATLDAYISAILSPVPLTEITNTGVQVINASPGVVGRETISAGANSIFIDSYKSSKGAYGVALAAGTYTGQLGAANRGSRGDVRTNNENDGYVNITNGTVTGGGYSTLPKISTDGSYSYDPITIDPSHVLYTSGVPFDESKKHYNQSPLTFPDIDNPPPPPSGSPDFTWATNSSKTLPSGNYDTIRVTKGTLTVPPGNYGTMDMSSQGTIVLGQPDQITTYNFQNFTASAQTNIIYRGPVVINVKTSLDIGAQGQVSNLALPASSVRWNFKGGSGQTVSVGGGGNTLGVFYAPNNVLYMRGGTTFFGAIAARRVDVGGTADIHIDEDALSGVLTTVDTTTITTSIVGYTASSYSLWRITQAIE